MTDRGRCVEKTGCPLLRGLSASAEPIQHGAVDESQRQLLGQCADGELVCESEKEEVHLTRYATRDAARLAIFEYVEVFYNKVRRHSTINNQSPADFAWQRSVLPNLHNALSRNSGQ